MATDLSISLPDEPGGLAKAAGALGAAGVNVEGIAGLGGGGHGHVHLLVEDAAAARSALEGAGVTIEGEREAQIVHRAAVGPEQVARHRAQVVEQDRALLVGIGIQGDAALLQQHLAEVIAGIEGHP